MTSREAIENNQAYSKREFIRADRYNGVARDNSSINTCSRRAKELFLTLANEDSAKSNLTTNNDNLFNRINIYSAEKSNVSLENFTAKDKNMFYAVSATMLQNIVNNSKDDVFPLTVSQSIVKGGKEEIVESEFSKTDLAKLAEHYENKAKVSEKIVNKENIKQQIPEKTL